MLLLGLVLAASSAMAPGDAIGLEPGARPAGGAPALAPPVSVGLDVDDPGPMPPIHLGALAASVAAIAQWLKRKEEYLDAVEAGGAITMRVVVMPGFGAQHEGTFAELLARLQAHGITVEVSRPDYRNSEAWDSHAKAAEKISNDELADGLGWHLNAMPADEGPIYLVGFSKGAAGIAELLSRWDLRPEQANPLVVGAALLEPPIAAGSLGAAQSAGRSLLSFIPNDGGYTPLHCTMGVLGCADTREHLGKAAGVEVVVFRNPDGRVTSFTDNPAGLRVYDITDPDGGDGVGDIAAAHSYPLSSAAVAACIADEMRHRGSCDWQARRFIEHG